jgi:two-component system phosphate regulon response regulator PhoB
MVMQTNLRPNQLSILVVDDDRAISKLIKYNLENKGIRVVEAATGLEGIKILGEAKVDLVLLDLRLPDFNGWGILSLLRLTESLSKIPVIVTSMEPPDTALIAKLHPDEYIQKPFDIRDLLMRVRKAIGSSKANRKLANKFA